MTWFIAIYLSYLDQHIDAYKHLAKRATKFHFGLLFKRAGPRAVTSLQACDSLDREYRENKQLIYVQSYGFLQIQPLTSGDLAVTNKTLPVQAFSWSFAGCGDMFVIYVLPSAQLST